MKYVSTRGEAPALGFEETLLAGLARDGGLYMPETWPRLSPDEITALQGLSYAELAARIMAPFTGEDVPADRLGAMADEVYGRFGHKAVTPLVQTGPNDWILELFHGPTLAFKDLAMQMLGVLFEEALAKRGAAATVVGATSGDTGSAAIEALKGRENIEVFILHPKGRVSEVQRRQMTTIPDKNVHNLAIEGTFDDCQALVKGLFNDAGFRDQVRLAGVNSINWARVMAQIVYYFHACLSLGGPGRAMSFTVPTGNFGDIFAGYAARNMGLPIERLVIATNVNDILARTVRTGRYEAEGVVATLSPSMDIQISSNFERLLFDLYMWDAEAVHRLMARFAQSRAFTLDDGPLMRLREIFDAARVDEAETLATIAAIYRETGQLIDPHTAVGVAAARHCRGAARIPMITLATAHPAKFPDAVEKATGIRPALPPRLVDLLEREERCVALPNDLQAVQTFIREHTGP